MDEEYSEKVLECTSQQSEPSRQVAKFGRPNITLLNSNVNNADNVRGFKVQRNTERLGLRLLPSWSTESSSQAPTLFRACVLYDVEGDVNVNGKDAMWLDRRTPEPGTAIVRQVR
jgi:hypothetical protein